MADLNEVKTQLDSYYQEYKDSKNNLNGAKTKAAASLIAEIALSKDGSPREAAAELVRFSADVANEFFVTVTKSKSVSIEMIDEILKELRATEKDSKLLQYYVSKYVFAVSAIMKYHKEASANSSQLPRLVAFIAVFAVKSEKNLAKFSNLIKNTNGGIFKLEYSNTPKSSLVNIWNALNKIYPDMSKAEYSSLITEWAEKYGFIKTGVSEKQPTSNNITAAAPAAEQKKAEENTVVSTEKNDDIIAAVSDMLSPIRNAVEKIQEEIIKNRNLELEISILKNKLNDTESKLLQAESSLKERNNSLADEKRANEELKNKISTLADQNSELDAKLSDAYKINSREASLEAEKIRTELGKAFAFLYEDWLEYEFSEVSEENYESLQAIVKKAFRSLDRNGIKYKGNE